MRRRRRSTADADASASACVGRMRRVSLLLALLLLCGSSASSADTPWRAAPRDCGRSRRQEGGRRVVEQLVVVLSFSLCEGSLLLVPGIGRPAAAAIPVRRPVARSCHSHWSEHACHTHTDRHTLLSLSVCCSPCACCPVPRCPVCALSVCSAAVGAVLYTQTGPFRCPFLPEA